MQVQKKELEELNIINNVSEYSYINGEFVYLEEDCDLNLFIKAYENKYNVKPIIKECLQENNEFAFMVDLRKRYNMAFPISYDSEYIFNKYLLQS